MSIDVFISYRGADRVLARRLEQRLRSRWGSRVFRDETSLMAGRLWSEQLRAAMAQAKVMLALIGPGWHVREEGEDWVRDELLGAIEAGNPVLPVLIGDPDKLKSRLGDLPDAFHRQAVCVSRDLAGFDLHRVETALRNLGAFGERHSGGLNRQLSETLPDQCAELTANVLEGQSVVIAGVSGSGRGALIRHIARSVSGQGGLVAAHGINLSARSRRTHSVVASWIDALCALLQDLPREDRTLFGPALVNAVLEFGPDLLTRQVLRPAPLMQLGDDDSDQKILDAAQRPTDRWAPFPPERLVSQSMGVLEKFVDECNLPLTLIIDNVDSVDGSSKDLIRRLLRSFNPSVRLVIATSAVRESTEPESAKKSVARALEIDQDLLENFRSISLHDARTWGKPGAVIQRWLDKHKVRLDDGVSESFKDSNPYYALSALWYLVDNGHVVEEPHKVYEGVESAQSQDEDVVTWICSRPDEPLIVPGRDRLLDHMIEEFVPISFRPIVEAGSLIGRRFLFSAAYAAAYPPESVDGQPPGSEAIARWSSEADQYWDKLRQVDPDGAVIVCHLSADNERMINLAQIDLVLHLSNQIDKARKLQWHERLAAYFRQPIANDCSSTLDDNYRNSRSAAAHWASANEPRHAADAERVAAGLAEEALAYPEARRHYQRAIRLFTQLLANKEHRLTFELVDHEDLLILANCLYRLGQMTRLANERRTHTYCSADPTKYFEQALKRLGELSKNLHDKRMVAPSSGLQSEYTRRDLPEPNLIRHHIRLCETLSGWVKLELAEWYSEKDPEKSRCLLFDALRHAESARGEADSRWLLAAASAQLSQNLLDDAIEAQQSGYPVRSHNLAIEAQFHIERVVGLAAVSPDEDRNLEEPRSLAWTVLGQLFQTIALEPQLAQWSFFKMNDHRHEVSDLVDMMTDRRLGLFLLSRHCGVCDARAGKARELLERHKRWAIESGIFYEHSGAYISLALLELVEQSKASLPDLQSAQQHIDRAVQCATDRTQKQNAYLLQGLLHSIKLAGKDGVAYAHDAVVEAFRHAGISDTSSNSTNQEVLFAGWKVLLVRLLRWCPHLENLIGVSQLSTPALAGKKYVTARQQFFSKLLAANNGELQRSVDRGLSYLGSVSDESLLPSNDLLIWRLLKSRVPNECYQHALRTKTIAQELLIQHRDLLNADDVTLALLGRDLAYAIAVHEWYRSTDPSRLLTLARESNMRIDGHEWASPKLLTGRLAIQLLDSQYGAEKEIGRQRLRKIESMVTNWAKGAEDVGPLEQIFHIAVQLAEPKTGQTDMGWRTLVKQSTTLSEAYRLSLREREKHVHQAGLPLVQDLHLLDIDSEVDPPSAGLKNRGESHVAAAQASLRPVDISVGEIESSKATDAVT